MNKLPLGCDANSSPVWLVKRPIHVIGKTNVFGVVADGLFASVDVKHSFNHCNRIGYVMVSVLASSG
jgi:hypothetical protein